MAKKNKLGKKPVVIGAVATIITITIVFLLFPNILSEGIVTTKTNEQLIKEGFDAGLLKIPFECAIESECEDGQGKVGESKDTNPIGEIIDPKPTNSTDIIPELVCDPPAELVGDQCFLPEPTLPVPFIEPPTVELISKVIKIDNNGTRHESTINFVIPLLSFFVEDTTNIDFDEGFIENQLFISTDPMIAVSGKGFFDIKIANQTILTQPIEISVSGMTDQNGQLAIQFVSPLGSKSDIFLFQFKDNLDKFATQGLTKIEYKVTDFALIVNTFDFNVDEETIFEMDIARDPNLIIIVNEEGGTQRIFPTDDRIRLCSSTSSYCYKVCYVNSPTFGCQKYRKVCQRVSAPTVGAWKFFKFDVEGNEMLFEQGDSFRMATAGSLCPLDVTVQRNEIYKIEVGSPTIGNVKWKTPMEQETYLFQCVRQYTGLAPTGFVLSCNFRTQDNQAFINSLELVP